MLHRLRVSIIAFQGACQRVVSVAMHPSTYIYSPDRYSIPLFGLSPYDLNLFSYDKIGCPTKGNQDAQEIKFEVIFDQKYNMHCTEGISTWLADAMKNEDFKCAQYAR